jgi:hypothetical protein
LDHIVFREENQVSAGRIRRSGDEDADDLSAGLEADFMMLFAGDESD